WLSGRSVSSNNLVRIQFANVSGLKRASPVRVSGVNVGKVERIEFIDVGKVLVIASLPPKIKARVDAEAKIVSVTLVGDDAVDLGAVTPLLSGINARTYQNKVQASAGEHPPRQCSRPSRPQPYLDPHRHTPRQSRGEDGPAHRHRLTGRQPPDRGQPRAGHAG